MDTFSALVIYMALTALAADPGLWLPLNNGDNLLFERKDFCPPFETEVWKHLARVGDAEVDRLAHKLKACCAPGWVAAKGLTAMIEPTWWERTRVSPAPGTKAGPAPARPSAPADSAPRAAQGQYRSARTGSVPLPPPPAWPYQTKVAAQSQSPPPPPSGTGSRSQPKAKLAGSAMPTSKAGIPVWWQPQAPPPAPAPAAPAKPASSGGRTAGKLCVIVAVILFVLFLAVQQPVAAVVIGVAGVGTGSLLIRGNPSKPPGQLPPGGTSQGPK